MKRPVLWMLFFAVLTFLKPPLVLNAAEDLYIVAVVNDEIITSKDLNESIFYFKEHYMGLADPGKRGTTEKRGKRELLEELIRDRLFDQEMKRLGITVTPEEVDHEVERLMKGARLGPDEFRRELKSRGVSLEQYRESLGDQLRLHKFIVRKIRSKIEIDERDILDYYRGHKAEYSASDKVHLVKIWGKSTLSEKDQVAILNLVARINMYVDLQLLQKKRPELKITDYGLVQTSDLSKDFREALQNTSSGGVARISSKENDWAFLKVFHETEISTEDLPEALKEEIRSRLFEKAVEQELDLYIQNLRRNAHIEIRLQEAQNK